MIRQKINHVHQNPVEAGLVFRAEDYKYSSAIDYADEKGLLDNIIVLECLINSIETTRKDSCGIIDKSFPLLFNCKSEVNHKKVKSIMSNL